MRSIKCRCLLIWLGCAFLPACSRSDDAAPRSSPAPAVTPAGFTLAVAPPLAERPAGHRRMVAAIAETAETAKTTHPFFSRKQITDAHDALDALSQDAPVAQRLQLLLRLGLADLNLGQVDAAVADLTTAYELLDDPGLAPMADALIRYYLGLAYLRKGEIENCCVRSNQDSCILPIRGGGVHDRPEGSRQAIRFFEEAIAAVDHPADRLNSTWLVNIAYMTLGEYPDGVPQEHRIAPSYFTGSVPFPRFVNIAAEIGIDTFNNSGGVVVDDFDRDGYLDILTSTWDLEGPMRFFLSNGDGTYTERSREAGLDGITGALNMVHADYDNDGDVDVYLQRGAWGETHGRYPNSLLRNEGDGTFTDVTFDAGLGEVHYPTLSAGWADYDNDGDVDLLVGNETTPKLEAPCQLFRNNGNGTFTDVATEAGVTNLRCTKGVAWGDYDGDGDMDLYLSNLGWSSPSGQRRGQNRLYRNDGDGTFTDVAPELAVTAPVKSFPTWFWDFDNDGNLDIFVATYDGKSTHVAAFYAGFEPRHEPTRLYRGDGVGGFVDVASTHGLMYPMLPMGSNFGDVDGDGFLDFYLGTGDPSYESLMPNLMFLNQGGRGFENVTMEGGFGHLQKGHAVAFADLDHDGDLDVFEQMGGAFPGDEFSDALYENPGFGHAWIAIELEGVDSNRSGIGARLRVDVRDPDGVPRTIYRHVSSGGSFGCNPFRQTIGIGDADQVERLEVHWPTTGQTQVFENVEVGQILRIVEGRETLERLDVDSFDLSRP